MSDLLVVDIITVLMWTRLLYLCEQYFNYTLFVLEDLYSFVLEDLYNVYERFNRNLVSAKFLLMSLATTLNSLFIH